MCGGSQWAFGAILTYLSAAPTFIRFRESLKLGMFIPDTRGKSCFLAFPNLGVACLCGLMAHSSIFTVSSIAPPNLSHSDPPDSLSGGHLWLHLGLTWTIQDSPPITGSSTQPQLQSPLCRVSLPSHRFQGFRHRYFGRPLFYLPHCLPHPLAVTHTHTHKWLCSHIRHLQRAPVLRQKVFFFRVFSTAPTTEALRE